MRKTTKIPKLSDTEKRINRMDLRSLADMRARRPTACVDFDGVICQYLGWSAHGESPGPLLFGAKRALELLRDAGFRVVVFTTRDKAQTGQTLAVHGILDLVDEVTDRKPPAKVFFDDRAVRVERNTQYALLDVADKWLGSNDARHLED